MLFKIRTKLLSAFFAFIVPFIVTGAILVFYSADTIHKSVHKVQSIAEERAVITNLILTMEEALMPGNDYIVTGDKKYIDDFYKVSDEVEKRMKEAKGIIHDAVEEGKILDDTNIAWQGIKEISLKIFAISNPAGNRDAAMLMEEMDYKWAYPAIKRLKDLREMHIEEFQKAANTAGKAWMHSWIIIVSGTFVFTAFGILFAFFYSRRFSGPIEKIHNAADVIAGGDFKTRLDIKTGDEIEQLSNAMNEMAAQLDSLYSNLQGMVEERTKGLKESEEMYRSLFEHMLNGFAYCRMLFEHGQPQDFIYLSVNDAFEALTGLRGVVGKKVTEVIPGIREADPGLFEIYGRVALSGNPERFEMYVESLRMWFWISVYSPHKEHFVAVFDVITERKKAEEAIKENEERFRTITNTAGDAIIGLEEPGMINFWNRKAEEIFGFLADEVTGRDMHDLIVPEKYREKAHEGLKGFFQTGAGPVVGKTVEITALRKDGTEFPIALSISAMKIQGKWQATGIIRDITERKRAEDELAKHVDELERYMKATVQREFRIKELRDRVEELEKRLKG